MSASDLLIEVLKLPRQQRQALAEQVWQSLDVDDDPSEWTDKVPGEPPFVEEFKRRVAAVQSGNYESMSLEESKALAWKALAEAKR